MFIQCWKYTLKAIYMWQVYSATCLTIATWQTFLLSSQSDRPKFKFVWQVHLWSHKDYNWIGFLFTIVRCSKVFADFHFHHHQSLFKHNIHCCQSSAHHLAVSKMRPCFLNSLSIALCQVDLVPFDVTRSAKVPQSTIKSFNRIPIKNPLLPLSLYIIKWSMSSNLPVFKICRKIPAQSEFLKKILEVNLTTWIMQLFWMQQMQRMKA